MSQSEEPRRSICRSWRLPTILCAVSILGSCATIDTAMEGVATAPLSGESLQDRSAFGSAPTHGSLPNSPIGVIDDPVATRIVAIAQRTPELTAARTSALATRRAGLGTAWATLLPNLSATASFDRNNQAIDAETGKRKEETRYTVGVTAGFSPDLWGGAINSLLAVINEAEAERLSLHRSGDVSAVQALTHYIQLAAAVESRSIQRERIRILSTIVNVVEERMLRGTANADDLSNARSTLYSAQAELAAAEADVDTIRLTLELLLGRSLEELGVPIEGPTSIPTVALPAVDVLQASASVGARSDLVAAQERARAARHNAYAAMARTLPSFRLEASLLRNDTELSDVMDARDDWRVTGTLSIPLFEGGNRAAQTLSAFSAAEALELERDAMYHRIRIERQRALSNDDRFGAQLEHLSRARGEAEATVRAYQRRYEEGALEIEAVLAVQEQAAVIRLQSTSLEVARAVNRISLALAFGVPLARSGVE